tara:strand:+ start:2053 stop:2373 length:321 start_codon:yes stop_codon:yes gene_type:complete
MYKAIIEGKTYNTNTAWLICELPCSTESVSYFDWHMTDLYRTKKGAYFLAGEGGPLSMWSSDQGNGNKGSGEGIRVIDAAQARQHMEDAGCDAEDFAEYGFSVEEG